jgi:hypothetical protein
MQLGVALLDSAGDAKVLEYEASGQNGSLVFGGESVAALTECEAAVASDVLQLRQQQTDRPE